MKNLKYILESVLCGGLVFVICYLLGAFAAADFNIINWDPTMRFFVAFFGGILSVSAIGVYYANNADI